MTVEIENKASPWPISVTLQAVEHPNPGGVIQIRPGITTLVGPNGSGKTRALRAIKDQIGRHVGPNRKTHFLAAGRSSPLEHYRAAINSPGMSPSADAAVGHVDYRQQWWNFESVTGILLALDSRADLRLKVEARLQQLFDRSVQFAWSQSGLNVRITPMSGGQSYSASREASGILHLVALLAAIHNDEIGALLIDEPEISLHPQHQAFLLEEMEKVAGDPSDPTRKLIVLATHSASLLPLRRISELPSIAFFNSVRQPPAQVPAGEGMLKRGKLGSLVARLSTTHRMAVFAERVLMVEGVSDEIIATQLARRLDLRLLARNAQILPVTGKGDFIEASNLFRLMKKHVAVLADLDALADDNGLVCHFGNLPEAADVAAKLGRKKIADLDGELRNELGAFMARHQGVVLELAATYKDWSSRESSDLSVRRVTLARLLTDPETFGEAASVEAMGLHTRFSVLLDALNKLGCFFLHKGAIENYYRTPVENLSKPELATAEADQFETNDAEVLKRDYSHVIAALSYIAPNQQVDEDQLLRPKLGAVMAAAFLGMDRNSSDEQLNMLAKTTIGTDAEVFKLINRSKHDDLRIEVQIASPLFHRPTFPFDVGHNDNPNIVVPNKLPGTGKG